MPLEAVAAARAGLQRTQAEVQRYLLEDAGFVRSMIRLHMKEDRCMRYLVEPECGLGQPAADSAIDEVTGERYRDCASTAADAATLNAMGAQAMSKLTKAQLNPFK